MGTQHPSYKLVCSFLSMVNMKSSSLVKFSTSELISKLISKKQAEISVQAGTGLAQVWHRE